MARVERGAGRRRAEPVRTPKRHSRSTRTPGSPGGPRSTRGRRQWRAPAHRTLRIVWLGVVALATAGLVLAEVADPPELLRQSSTGLLSSALALGLSVRTSGRPFWVVLLTTGIVTTAFISGWAPLLAGAAVGTAVIAGVLAVMATIPAATFAGAIREALVATLVAAVGAIAVTGYGVGQSVQVDTSRLGYVVLTLAIISAIALVYRLGAGLHGLGRRGYLLVAGAVLMLGIALAYSAALAQWGSRDLVDSIDSVRGWTREHFNAVPHPIAALLGYPALVWGVFMRARRRQGWWVCAFGVAATAPATTRLVDQGVRLQATLLSGVYSLVVGLAIGYVVIRIEQTLTGTRGSRARRSEEALAHRPEPGRMSALH